MTPPPDPPKPRPQRVLPKVEAVRLPTLQRVDLDRIVTVEGVTGVFTPLTGKGDTPASNANLSRIIDALRGEVAELRSRNAALLEKLEALTDPPRSSDDLADGVRHALDGLADRLGAMANTTSNFAVREFTLESKVHVDVTPLGTIGFQFVRPGDQVNPASLSTVSLTVVPVPKPVAEEAEPAPPTPAAQPVEAVDGLTPTQAAALRAAHVSTAGDFARVATRAHVSAQLESLLGVDREALGRLTLLAGLLGVPGLDRLRAAVLYDAGVVDVATLAASDPLDLVARYAAAAAQRPDDDGWRPTGADAAAWVRAASGLGARHSHS